MTSYKIKIRSKQITRKVTQTDCSLILTVDSKALMLIGIIITIGNNGGSMADKVLNEWSSAKNNKNKNDERRYDVDDDIEVVNADANNDLALTRTNWQEDAQVNYKITNHNTFVYVPCPPPNSTKF